MLNRALYIGVLLLTSHAVAQNFSLYPTVDEVSLATALNISDDCLEALWVLYSLWVDCKWKYIVLERGVGLPAQLPLSWFSLQCQLQWHESRIYNILLLADIWAAIPLYLATQPCFRWPVQWTTTGGFQTTLPISAQMPASRLFKTGTTMLQTDAFLTALWHTIKLLMLDPSLEGSTTVFKLHVSRLGSKLKSILTPELKYVDK